MLSLPKLATLRPPFDLAHLVFIYLPPGAEMADWWEGRRVRIAVPTGRAVLHMYGPNWRHPFPNYRWDLDSFLTGYCRY